MVKRKMEPGTNNELQNTTQKTKDCAARTRVPQKGSSSGSTCTGRSRRVTLTTN